MPGERPPLTVKEWLENVRSRGGSDAEWAHKLLRDDRERRLPSHYMEETL